MSDPFVHLHVHSEFSLLDGAAKIEPLVQAAVADGQPALAITDHGVCYGLIEFYKTCKSHGIKPILGIEAYMARNSVEERPKRKSKKKADDGGGEDDKGQKLYYHLTILAENNEGYQNLMKLSSDAFIKGWYRKARVDWDILSDHSKGLIATSGCLGGVVLQELLHGNDDEALAAAARLQDIFGQENFFIELQDHGIADQIKTNPQLIEIAKTLSAPLLATNDSHYVNHSDAQAHDALLCVQTNARIHENDRFKFHGDNFYLKSANEMRAIFDEVPDACDNTLLIAERVDIEIEFGRDLTPVFPIPDGYIDEEDYLRSLVIEGAQKRWALTDEVINRLDYELDVITTMGFSGYFLIVWDLVQHARSVGIRMGPGRGSAGGCAIAFALGITEIDPLQWGLLFERFLNPERVSMPDIDIDFDSRYRDHMINYVSHKYGEDRVAQVITFGSIKSRQAVRDAARVMDLPFLEGDKIAKALPPLLFGRDTPIKACLVEDPKHKQGYEQAFRFRNLYEVDDIAHGIIDIAKGLEGLRKSDGIHAAAVVISPDTLTNYVPVQKKTDKPLATQYEMHALEELGLLKMDFLAVKNLDSLTDTVRLIKERHGIELDLMKLPLDDPGVFEMLSEGDTTAVFQLESKDMKALLRSLMPRDFEDIAAVIALYRPGPLAANMHIDYADRRNNRASVQPFHPDATDLLVETYGLMIFQEQLMTVAQRFAGYSLGEGYQLVKTCAKKLPEAMEEERGRFIAGVTERYDLALGEQLFDTVAEFAHYAFNKSHSYGYAYIAYQTAYLKRHYPVEYMSAVLNTVQSDHDRLGRYLSYARQMGLEVKSPDINLSTHEFMPVDDQCIVFGLAGVKGIGLDSAYDIASERDNGPYASFFDYIDRVPKRAINKRVLEALIQTGAFDSLGHPRKGLLNIMPDALKTATKDRKAEAKGDVRLFDIDPEVHTQGIPDLDFEETELLRLEKELLGVYVSGHPLDSLLDQLDDCTTHTIASINELEEGAPAPKDVIIAGLITDVTERVTRKGDSMMNFTLEDITGEINCVVFPQQYTLFSRFIVTDDIVMVEAELKENRGSLDAILRSVNVLQKAQQRSGCVHVYVPDAFPMATIREALAASEGPLDVVLHSDLIGVRKYDTTVDIEKFKKALSLSLEA